MPSTGSTLGRGHIVYRFIVSRVKITQLEILSGPLPVRIHWSGQLATSSSGAWGPFFSRKVGSVDSHVKATIYRSS